MREKLVRQHSIKDCGPCSLASIISYYKGYISVDALSSMMHTSSSGTTAYDLIETAKRIGFDAKGIKTSNIYKIKLPCICHVILDNTYHHYVVLYKINKKNRLLIGDPASGFKNYTLEEFMNIWSKFVIELIPLKKLPNIKHKPLIKYLFEIYKSNINIFIIIILLSYLLMIFTYVYTFFLNYILDHINDLNIIFIYGFIFLGLFKIVIYYLTDFYTINLTKKINIDLTNNIINSLINLPYPYYCNYTTGEIVSRYNDVEKVKLIISDVLNVIVCIPLVIIFVIILLKIHLKIGFFIIFILIFYSSIYILFNKEISSMLITYHNKKAVYNSYLVESLKNYESIKAINIKEKIINKLLKMNYRIEDNILLIQKIQILKNSSSLLLQLLFISFLLIVSSSFSINKIILFYYIFNSILDPLSKIMDFIINYKESSFIIRKIDEFKIKNNEGIRIPCNYNITFKNMDFYYDNNKVLNNVNLTINHGEKVFILGPSGSGKSTLVKLIKGFYKTNNLYLGDTKINRCSKDLIIYVGQNEHLFTDTVLNNLFSDKGYDFIKTCLVNKDLNYLIEEDGFNLSGGEKSRIVLSRAISRDFEILILDEALENVDSNTERIILKNLLELFHNKTIIFISHRLDNLDLFSTLLKIENGFVNKIGYLN